MTYLLSVLAALSMLPSCEGLGGDGSADRVSVSFLVVGQGTKAAVGAHESDIASLDVLVYDAASGRASAGGHSDGGAVTVEVTKGSTLTYFVVANAPKGAFAGCTTVTAFRTKLSFLQDNTSGTLVMVSGAGTKTFTEATDVSVELSRLCSKVVLGSVTPALRDAEELSGASIVFDRAYLINVAGSCTFGLEPSADGLWYNKSVFDEGLDDTIADYLCSEAGISVTSSSTIETGYSFYCMPNPTDNGVNFATESVWSPRDTRLVLEFTVDGMKTWYPIDIPAMECNKCYLIRNLTITRMGSHQPDIPVGNDTVQFTVEITEWGTNDITDVVLQ